MSPVTAEPHGRKELAITLCSSLPCLFEISNSQIMNEEASDASEQAMSKVRLLLKAVSVVSGTLMRRVKLMGLTVIP